MKFTLRYIIIKSSKFKDKENLKTVRETDLLPTREIIQTICRFLSRNLAGQKGVK
jgi:hypothetical protein